MFKKHQKTLLKNPVIWYHIFMQDTIRVIIAGTMINSSSGIVITNISDDFKSVTLDPLTVSSASKINSYHMMLKGIDNFFSSIDIESIKNYHFIFYINCRELIDDFNTGSYRQDKKLWAKINSYNISMIIKATTKLMNYVSSLEDA